MSITIKRRSELFRGSTTLTLRMNGEKIEKIDKDEEKEIDLPKNQATLQVKQFGGKSNVLEVSEGDVVEISTASWTYWAFFLLIGMIPIFMNFSSETYQLTGLLLLILLYGFVFFTFNTFKLTKVSSNGMETSDN